MKQPFSDSDQLKTSYLTPRNELIILKIKSDTRGNKKIRRMTVRNLLSIPKEDSTAKFMSSKEIKAEQNTAKTTALSGHEEYLLPSVNFRPSKVPRVCIVVLKTITNIKNALELQILHTLGSSQTPPGMIRGRSHISHQV